MKIQAKTWSMVFAGILVLSALLSVTANVLTIREYIKAHKKAA